MQIVCLQAAAAKLLPGKSWCISLLYSVTIQVNDEIFALRKNAGASNQKHLLLEEQGTNCCCTAMVPYLLTACLAYL
eukprot:scaffold1500_cov106-Skeletonema_dohrnii-CCMP3373.AAC.11